jgi:hypothetical protein
LLSGALFGAPAGPLTPENAVDVLYTHIKRSDYTPLLALCVDPERKRIDALMTQMDTDRRVQEETYRRANLLEGYSIHASEVYDTAAVIMFTWKYKNDMPAAAQPDIVNPTVIERGCEALLLKENNTWKLASTRAWVPENERGAAFIQQQKAAKEN